MRALIQRASTPASHGFQDLSGRPEKFIASGERPGALMAISLEFSAKTKGG